VTIATVAGLGLILAGSWLAAEGRLPWRPRIALAETAPPLPVAEPSARETR